MAAGWRRLLRLYLVTLRVSVKKYSKREEGRGHSYFVANARISLGVEVRPGNEHAAARGMPQLWKTLERLPRPQWAHLRTGRLRLGRMVQSGGMCTVKFLYPPKRCHPLQKLARLTL